MSQAPTDTVVSEERLVALIESLRIRRSMGHTEQRMTDQDTRLALEELRSRRTATPQSGGVVRKAAEWHEDEEKRYASLMRDTGPSGDGYERFSAFRFAHHESAERLRALSASPLTEEQPVAKFKLGDRVRKTKGSAWRGHVVGTYSTELTPEGYSVESENEPGSVQLYPAAALEALPRSTTGGAK